MSLKVENFIGIYEDAFTKEYCDSVINFFEDSVKAGFGLTRQQQGAGKLKKDDTQIYAHSEIELKYTNNLINDFNSIFWGQIYAEYIDIFAGLKDYDPHANYAFKVQKTEIGQGYHVWHAETDSRDLCNRILAWTLYLNDVEEGGETEFLYYPKRIKPKTGTVILWPAGFTHTHRGNPPISNTKYIVTGWIEF